MSTASDDLQKITLTDVCMEECRRAEEEYARAHRATGRRSRDILDEQLRAARPQGLSSLLTDTVLHTCWRLRRWPYGVGPAQLDGGDAVAILWRGWRNRQIHVSLVLAANHMILHVRGPISRETVLCEYVGPVWWGYVRDYCEEAIKWLREVEHESDS